MKLTILKTTKRTLIVSGMIIMLFQGCTEHFEEINTNPYGVSQKQLETDYNSLVGPIRQAVQAIYVYAPEWQTQLQSNLNSDIYSGYMMSPTPFENNSNNMTYSLVDGWNGFPWSIAYQQVMGPLRDLDRIAGEDFEDFRAWAKIIRVEAMHRVSDIYGPIIYSHFGETPALYDSQEEVYNLFFQDLDEAVTTLTPLADAGATQFVAGDLVYGGDISKWVQFANSLRLRLAIRISDVNPDLAKTQAEAAVSHPLGVITGNEGNFLVQSSAGVSHPLNTISSSWHDIRMNAVMESYLTGYSDARIDKYFQVAIDPLVEGQFKGIRQGIDIEAKTTYENFSPLAVLGMIQLMTAAEVYFLRAEGALRGWDMGGTAGDLYALGVQTSFAQHGLSGNTDAYLADATSTAAPYVDPVNSDNSVLAGSPYLSTITIQWEDGADFDTKLERIITQKWLAMYPDGQEAWSEFRRTGYPVLFPVVVNTSGGAISTEGFVKRLNFPAGEKATNPDGVASGEAKLGGPDTGGTPLWWDVD